MKSLLLSITVLISGSFAVAEPADVDFNKVNKVIAGIANSLISGDELVTSLSGSFDPEATSLSDKKVKGQVSASISRTLWSQVESSVQLETSIERVSGDEYEETMKFKMGGVLKTAVISLTQYAFEKAGCALTEEEEVLSVYGHLSNEICPMLNERVPALQEIDDLIQLVIESYELIQSQTDIYIQMMTERLGETEDGNQKDLLEALIYAADSLQSELKRFTFERNENSLTFIFLLDDLMYQPVRGQIQSRILAEQFDLGIELEYIVPKEILDDVFSWVKNVAMGLQSESTEVIEEITRILRSYMELVKSMIAE